MDGELGSIRRTGEALLGLLALVMMVALPLAASVLASLAEAALAALPVPWEVLGSPENLHSVATYLIMAAPIAWWARRAGVGFPPARGSRDPSLLAGDIAAAALLGIGVQYAVGIVFALFAALAPAQLEGYNEMVASSGILTFDAAWILSTFLLPPIVEETVFRGVALGHLERAGLPFAAANAIQAAGFGLFHMNPVQGAYAFLIGLALGYVARRCGSLLPAMALHAVFNLSGTLGAGVLDALVPTGPLGQALAGAAISATAIAWIERRHRRRPAG